MKIRTFFELCGTVLMAVVIVAAIIGLFLNEMSLYDECERDGHSFLYCMRILSR